MEWIEVLFSARNLNMVIFPKAILLEMITEISNETRYKLEGQIAEHIVEYFQFLHSSHRGHLSNEEYYHIVERLLGEKGLMWLDHLEFSIDSQKKIQYFQGTHRLGALWSEFVFNAVKIILEEQFSAIILLDSVIVGNHLVSFEFTLPKE